MGFPVRKPSDRPDANGRLMDRSFYILPYPILDSIHHTFQIPLNNFLFGKLPSRV